MAREEQALPKSDFRQGRRVPRNVYHGDEPLFMAATDELAAELVMILNAGAAALRAPQGDGVEAKRTGASATPSGSQAAPEAPSDLRPEGFDPSRGSLLAKAREQFAYWQERVRRQKGFEECWNEDGTKYTPLGDDEAHELGYCKGRWAEAEWWMKTIEAFPAPSHEEIVEEMTRRIERAHAELSRVFPPDDRGLCECRIGQCRAVTELCREPEA